MKSKNLFSILSAIVLSLLFMVPANATEKTKKQKKGETTTVFKMEMDCQGCVNTVEKNIPWEKGVTDLKCDIKTQTVAVTYKTAKTNDSTLIAAFKKIGKDAVVVKEQEKKEEKK
ncbi:MAG: heavy metal-associated domain-containing protein [Bacteroidales bacterium]